MGTSTAASAGFSKAPAQTARPAHKPRAATAHEPTCRTNPVEAMRPAWRFSATNLMSGTSHSERKNCERVSWIAMARPCSPYSSRGKARSTSSRKAMP